MYKLILLLTILMSCRTTFFSELDNESFVNRYYSEISQNSFRNDGVYYTFDSTMVYKTKFINKLTYREKSFIDKNYSNSKNVKFDTSFKSYFISLMWFTDNGKVYKSEHGHYYDGASPGVEVVRKEVDIDSLKFHLLNEKINYINNNKFSNNDYSQEYSNKGFYRVSGNEMVIRFRRCTYHRETCYEEGFKAKIINDTTINYYIKLSPISGNHDFVFYKTNIQPPELFMRISR